ncbi:MAG: thioesterase [Desulfamplus sp.]|nr:thioesterase [Desulfamplus sp.]
MLKPINLICIPFAGGTSFAFRDINKHLHNNIKTTYIEYSGHGRRLNEPLLNDIHDLVSDIFHQLSYSDSFPFAIWGHSMGGTIAYLLTRRLLNAGLPLPHHLFVSGAPAPSIPRCERDVHKLPRDAFIEKVKNYGGVAEEVLAEKELMDLFIPILRSDFRALEVYEHISCPPLPVPITAMFGSDEHIKEEDVKVWQLETTSQLIIKKFRGNHFFIFDNMDKIGQMIENTLSDT